MLAGAGSVVYVGAELHAAWPQIHALDWGSRTLGFALVALLLQSAVVLFDGWCWGLLLRALGVRVDARSALSVFGVSQFAKYLPGNVAQHAGRIALSSRRGFQPGRVLVSMLLENAFAVGACAILATSAPLAWLPGVGNRPLLRLSALISAWLVGTLLVRHLLQRPPNRLRVWLALDSPVRLGFTTLAAYFLAHLGGVLAMCAVLVFVIAGLTGSGVVSISRLPAAVALSWLAGFLLPGAPAGMGIREAVLTSTLTPTEGASLALSAALLWRVVATLADVVVLLVAVVLGRDGERA